MSYFGCLLILVSVSCVPGQLRQCFYGGPRSFYNIGHMANSINSSDSFIRDGANAIEVDVSLRDGGLVTYHGFPCDCGRFCFESENFCKYLNHMKQYTELGNPKFGKLALLMLDMKLSSISSFARTEIVGQTVADCLYSSFYAHLERQAAMKVVISIEKVEHSDFVMKLENLMRNYPQKYGLMRPHIGWDISQSTDVASNLQLWRSLNIRENIWQGVGLTNCFPISGWIQAQYLRSALEARNDRKSPLKKVYRWTIDEENFLRASLSDQVDGIITNTPGKLRQLLRKRPFYEMFHLARLGQDDPWQKEVASQAKRGVAIPVIGEAIKAIESLILVPAEGISIPSELADC